MQEIKHTLRTQIKETTRMLRDESSHMQIQIINHRILTKKLYKHKLEKRIQPPSNGL